MRFPKSSKLLNYVTNTNGYLTFYTELDHSFIAGEYVYIVGGYYDNTESLSYITSNNLSSLTRYKVLFINTFNNSFTLDIPYNGINIVYPYGTINNLTGNIQDGINPGYNTQTDLYKDIFVSNNVFLKGRFVKGTINNGIFGNDYSIIKINKYYYSNTTHNDDININHICAKNVDINRGYIQSKTDQTSPNTSKYRLIEDTNYSITNVAITNNNDSYGYSYFEKFIGDNLLILNANFTNPKEDYIFVQNSTIYKGKIGNKEPREINGLKFIDCNFRNTKISNITTDPLESKGMQYTMNIDTFININPISVTKDPALNSKKLIIEVDYDVIANKNQPTNETVFVYGIKYNNGSIVNGDMFYSLNGVIDYVDTYTSYYNVDDRTSAKIQLYFSGFSNFMQSNFDLNDYDFSQMKILFTDPALTTKLENCIFTGQNGNDTTYINGHIRNSQLLNKIEFQSGILQNSTFKTTTTFKSTSFQNYILLQNNVQLLRGLINNVNPEFNYCLLNNNKPITGLFNNSKIESGVIQTSTIKNSHITTIRFTPTFLFNVSLLENNVVTEFVNQDLVSYQPNYALYNGVLDIDISDFKGRKTPFITGSNFNPNPISASSYAKNINTQEGKRDISYNSQSQVINANENTSGDLLIVPKDLTNFTYSGADGSNVYLVDKGDNIASNPQNNRNLVNYNQQTGSLEQPFLDIISNTTAGTYTTFPTVTGLAQVDDNFILTVDDYYELNRARTGIDMQMYISDISGRTNLVTQPDPSLTIGPKLIVLNQVSNVQTTIYPTIEDTYPYTNPAENVGNIETLVPSITDAYNIYFSYDNLTDPNLFVQASFIEVERVTLIQKNTSNVVLQKQYLNINNIPAVNTQTNFRYSYDVFVPGPSSAITNKFPRTFLLYNSPNNTDVNNLITFKLNNTYIQNRQAPRYEIIVEYWVTQYYNDTTDQKGGYRQKYKDTYKVQL